MFDFVLILGLLFSLKITSRWIIPPLCACIKYKSSGILPFLKVRSQTNAYDKAWPSHELENIRTRDLMMKTVDDRLVDLVSKQSQSPSSISVCRSSSCWVGSLQVNRTEIIKSARFLFAHFQKSSIDRNREQSNMRKQGEVDRGEILIRHTFKI